MIQEIGRVADLVRYPVKSMAGIAAEAAFLGWHGLDGDRRFAFRRLEDRSGFPWLSASRLPELILYHPVGHDESSGEVLPTEVRTPSGAQWPLGSRELQDEIATRLGSAVELMKLKHGIFDDAPVSVISLATIAGIGREAGLEAEGALDRRRFRANLVLDVGDREPFHEDGWVGGTLLIGATEPRVAVSVTACDPRCVMVNLDPDTAVQDKRVLKAVVRLNKNNAGVYGTTVRAGVVRVGDPVSLVLGERRKEPRGAAIPASA
jgi:uncharacterized protein YcbX